MASDPNNPNRKTGDRISEEKSTTSRNEKKAWKRKLTEEIEMELEKIDERIRIAKGSELDEETQMESEKLEELKHKMREKRDEFIALKIRNQKLKKRRAKLMSSEKGNHSKSTTDEEDKDV